MAAAADPRVNPGGLFDEPGCPTSFPCFVVDDYHAVAAGTSMSSPHVAGAVALLMQQDPTLTQARVTAVLQAGAELPMGHVPYDYQLGPGELDLDGALQALAVEQASSLAPDLGRSWYTLSSAYARSDPTWPIWGTVELRRADGTLASGLDGSKLAVDVLGGALIAPPTKVRDGLFRFAVAGPVGGNGTSMTVDVTYAGASMGTRTLPIGNDYWQEMGTIEAVGEQCGVTAGAGSGGGGSPRTAAAGSAALLVLLLGATRARRKRRATATPRGSS
jgi:subtilisin family serine protease